MNIESKKIGQRIRQARKEAGLTQKQLGEKLNKTGAAIGFLETGKRKISVDSLEKIAYLVNKPIDYFYEKGGDEDFELESKLMALEKYIEEVKNLLERKGVTTKKLLQTTVDYALISTDIDLKIVSYSKEAEKLLGWTQNEVIGKTIAVLHQKEDKEIIDFIKKQVLEREVFKGLVYLLNKRGRKIPVILSVSLLRTSADTVAGFIYVINKVNLDQLGNL